MERNLGSIFRLLLLIVFICSPVYAQQAGKAPLNIKTQDGTTNTYPYQLRVTNGTLTDNGDGTASLTTGGGGGSGYSTVQDEGSNLTQRAIINFTGTGVACADNSGSTRTDCVINSGAASAAGGQNAVQYNNSGALAGTETSFSFNGTNIGVGTTNGINAILDVRGDQYVSGNLGIGTTGPRVPLEVNGQVYVDNRILVNNGAVGTPSYSFFNSANSGIYAPIAGTTAISSSGAETMRVADTVSVGTTNTGTYTLRVHRDTGSSYIYTTSSDATGIAYIGNQQLSGAGAGVSLRAFGASSGSSLAGLSSDNSAGIRMDGNASDTTKPMFLSVESNNPLVFGVNASEKMRILNGGNVGIGSTAPGQVLDVNGNVHTGAGTSAVPAIGRIADRGTGLYYPATSQIALTNGTVESVRINASGNMGIGTTNPGRSLDINGALRAKGGAILGFPLTGDLSSFTAGNGSIATGYTQQAAATTNIKSTGNGSFAGGNSNIFDTTSSVVASADGSFAFGNSDGDTTTSIITATAPGSFAFGNSIGGTISASGNGAVAMGNAPGTTSISASGVGSIAMGYGPVVSSGSSGSVALGSVVTASNVNAIAIGSTNTSSGSGAVSIGNNLTASGGNSVAIGSGVTAGALNSVAIGSSVINNIASTVAIGVKADPTMTFTGANVGIGTRTPDAQLIINGQVGIGTANSNYVNAAIPPSGGMIIQGNVGVGTYAPIQKLQVAGTSQMTGFQLTGSGEAAGNVLVTNSVGLGTWMSPSTLPSSGGGTPGGGSNAIQYNSSPTGTFTGKENLFSFNGTNVGVGTTNGINAILDVRGNQYVSGNIGVGSTNPGVAVDVNGSVHASAGTSAIPSFGRVTDRGTGMYFPAASMLALTNNTVESVRVDASGNMGVGTTIPDHKVAIKGDLRLTGTNKIFLGDDSASTYTAIASSANTNGNLQFYTQGTQRFILDLNGNLGLGTAAPGQNLDILSGSNMRLVNGAFMLGGDNQKYIIPTASVGGDLRFVVTNIETMRMNAGNNVGIGSTAPGTKLDVTGTTRTTGLQLNLAPLAGGNVLVSNTVGVGTWMPPSVIAPNAPAGTTTQIQYNNAGAMAGSTVVTNGTNLGIGTTATANSLNLVGTVGISTTVVGSAVLTTLPANMALSVIGNVGIGTITAGARLSVNPGNVGIGTNIAPNALYVVGTPMFTTGLNIGIGTASLTRLCIANNAISTCP